MKFSDIPFHPTHKVLRQFAAAWLLFFLAIGARQWVARGHHELGLGFGILAVVMGALGLIKPDAVRWLFIGSMVLAFPLGWLLSQFVLALMFYGIITPIAVLFRIRARDLLDRKPVPDRASYFTPKQTPKDIRSYFHQY